MKVAYLQRGRLSKESSMKNIPGHEGRYSITSDGKIWSHRRNKWLKPTLGKIHNGTPGYFYVSICHGGRDKKEKIHRLVAITYIPNPDNLPQVNHKNGIKTDNRVENLEWCTPKENFLHAIETGLNVRNPAPAAKLSVAEVKEIRLSFSKGESRKTLEKRFSVSRTAISDIVSMKRWKKT